MPGPLKKQPGPEKKFLPLCLILIAVSAWAAFGSSIKGVFLWDDEYVVRQNLFIRDPSNLPLLVSDEYFAPAETGHYTRSGEESYRPLVTLTHFLDHAVFGLRPAGYHFVNLLIHTAASVALFFMLHALGAGPLASLIGAMIFAVHPVNSEAVNMISYREDLLAGFFLILAWAAYLKKQRPALILLYSAALLSKEMALCFIPLLLVHHFLAGRGEISGGTADPAAGKGAGPESFPGKPGSLKRPRLSNRAGNPRLLTPGLLGWLAIVTAGYLLILFYVFPGGSPQAAGYPGGSFLNGMATMSRVTAHYMKLMIYPFSLAVDPSFSPSSTPLDPSALLSALMISAVILLPLILPLDGKAAFLILWFPAALLPVSGLFPIKNFIAERYLYIPSMGWCGAAAIGLASLMKRRNMLRILSIIGLASILLLFICKNIQRNRIWGDEERFFEEMVRANPASYKGYSSLGMIYFNRGRLEEAEEALKRSVRMNGDYAISRHNLGCVLMKRGKHEAARAAFRRVIAMDPSFTEAYYQLALLLCEAGRESEAEKELRTALSLNPGFIPAKFVLASMLQDRQELKEAVGLYEEILSVDPGYAKAVKNLGVIHYYKFRDPARAAVYFRRYLELVPDDPQRRLILRAIEDAGKTDSPSRLE